MKRFLKWFFSSLLVLILAVCLYIGYVFFWSVKFNVGDCISNGATTYLFDSDGPIMKGAYGLTKLPKKPGDYGIAMPRHEIEEGDDWKKVECPRP
jgi:hypothetical protein